MKNHFDRDFSQGTVKSVGNIIGEINENGKEQPSGPELEEKAIDRTGPEKSKAEQAFDQVKGILNAPALPVKGGEFVWGKALWV